MRRRARDPGRSERPPLNPPNEGPQLKTARRNVRTPAALTLSIVLCCPPLALLPALAPGRIAGAATELPPEAEERIRRELRAERLEPASVSIPEGPEGELPAELRVPILRDGETRVLLLRRHSVRAPGFRLLIQGRGGELLDATPPPVRTYRGVVEGEPGSDVAATLRPSGLSASILPLDRREWKVRPLGELLEGAPPGAHIVFEEADDGSETDLPSLCGDMLFPPAAPETVAPETVAHSAETSDRLQASRAALDLGEAGSGAAACTLDVADIAFDSDHELYTRLGSDEAALVAFIEDGVNELNQIYIRDLRIIHRVSAIVVRTDAATDFWARYPDASDFDPMLRDFRSEWNANRQDIVRDMAYFVTGKSNPEYGGLAFVGAVCNSYAYGMGLGYSGFVAILRHELGHNWGAGHECGLERRFIMCGNSIDAFSGFNIERMSRYRDSLSCLDESQLESDPEAPFARPDFAVMYAGEGPIAIDVLSSDTDPNCDDLTIASHDERSALGAEIRLADTVPGRAAGFLYLPRSDAPGRDAFSYVVADGTGFEVPSTVLVEILPRAMVAYYPFEETTGTDVADASGYGRDGEMRGALSFEGSSVAGPFGRAIELSGVAGEYVSVEHHPTLGAPRGVTVAAWFRADAFAGDGETLVGKGSDSWRLERDGTRRTLRFTATGVAGGDARGTTPVDDAEWHHAAGVYDGTRVLLYVDGALDASVTATGRIHETTRDVHIGDDAFRGAIDEVRIYNHPLSAEEVAALWRGGQAANPSPPDGASGVNAGRRLSWIAAPGATAYDLYLGTDRTAVASATRGSPEYRGRIAGTEFAPGFDPGNDPGDDSGATWYWRVDPVLGAEALPGAVWSFGASFAFTNFDEPPLDAASFTPKPGDRELGFSTQWRATGGQSPFAGVVETGSTPTSPVFSHRSVEATTTFAPVDLSGRSAVRVSLELQARSTGYEAEDSLHAYVTDGADADDAAGGAGGADAARRIDLVRLVGGTTLSQVAGTGYQTFAATVPADWSSARLVISSSSDSSAGSERYDFDGMAFSCDRPYAPIARTLFEESAVGGASYTPGAGARELGFSTAFAPTSGASPVAAVLDAGEGARSLSFRSVRSTTTFDDVDLRGRKAVRVSLVVRAHDTGYEAEDLLEASVSGGGERIDLVRSSGADLSALADGEYHSFTAAIPLSWPSARLVLETSGNSSAGSERYDVRAVEFLSADASSPCGGEIPPAPVFRRGDANGDGTLDLSDGVSILLFLFLGSEPPACGDAGDTDDSGSLDVSDAIGVFNHLFLGGEAPPAPGAETCGEDPTEDELDCAEYEGC